ncbi:ABC transporter substrate-binding protein [Gordonia sp. X0973]|uniref:heme/hemin ABC transporter substrate-binding protein n=1 Tax=Gordonia sp. X0973 TaxID=2742602 RepID=UPI000F541BCB|nr:ABC transporter substrate-binding protein [Gordonia sp. X0973]QKT07174.1 ABC transporter substrate-binding protein [Gordonia sp. X0973]
MRLVTRAAVIGLTAVSVLVGGCSVTPLDVGGGAPSTASVPPGPRTASVPADPVPVVTDPVPQLPVTVPSADGPNVTVTDVSRIVALDRFGTYGTTVFALGLGSHLVGRDIATKFPASEHIPVLTPDGTNANLEALLALRPTVVLADASLPSIANLAVRLRAARIPVVLGETSRNPETAPAQLRSTAAALGVRAAGEQLAARTEDQIRQAKAVVPHLKTKPKIGFLYARGTGLMILGGPGSGASELIDFLGGIDAGTAAGLTDAYTSMTAEGLIKAAPDVLLMMTDGLASVGGIDGLEHVPGVAQTPAGRTRTVIDMGDGQLLTFGPRTGEVALALAKALYR